MDKLSQISILDVKCNLISVCCLQKIIVEYAKSDQKRVIANVNIKAVNLAHRTPWFKDFINNSEIVFCDGFGVLLGASLLGYPVSPNHRMTCPDYIEELAKTCEKEGVSLFLLAGKPGVVEKAIQKLKLAAPNLRIDGHHGYFDKVGKENSDVVQKVNHFKPHVLYVGFGMPLQEQWILENINDTDARVFLPLGACLDFYTGSLYRGPKWMTDSGLEWLSRLFTEPSRLWERYVIGNPLFFYRVLKTLITQRIPLKK